MLYLFARDPGGQVSRNLIPELSAAEQQSGMADKFLFKWNNFQSSVARSFGVLRAEEDLFDVTLVSEDQVAVSAHKLILSASSSFFKSILKKNVHSHPLIYLSEIHSSNLQRVLDYMYEGEVQLMEDQVESFLMVSNKLRIDGMVHDSSKLTETPPVSELPDLGSLAVKLESPHIITADIVKKAEEPKKPKKEKKPELVVVEDIELDEKIEENNPVVELKPTNEKFYITDVLEADLKIQEVMTKDEEGFKCSLCTYRSGYRHSVTGHIENKHIHGLSFNCEDCDKIFKNRNQLGNHRSKFHSRRSLTL